MVRKSLSGRSCDECRKDFTTSAFKLALSCAKCGYDVCPACHEGSDDGSEGSADGSEADCRPSSHTSRGGGGAPVPPLPRGWSKRVGENGAVEYAHESGATQKTVPAPLPPGWSMGYDPADKTVWYEHTDGRTQWEFPRDA